MPIHPHDTATFTKIYNEYFEQVYAYAREAGGADGFDIVHDAFLYLYQHDLVFESKEKVKNYLIKAVRSRVLNKKNAGRTIDVTEELLDIEDECAEVEGLFMGKVMKMFDQLPAETRKVLDLRYFKGMGVKEIAHELGITVMTVRSQCWYGIRKMRLFDGTYQIPKKKVERDEAIKTVREIVSKIGEREFTKIIQDSTFVPQLKGNKISQLSTKRILKNIERYNLMRQKITP